MNASYLDDSSLADRAAADAHEVMAHVYEYFKTGDVAKSDDKALRNTDIPKVQREAKANAEQKDPQ